MIDEALAHFGWQIEPGPQGKTIESIEIYVLDVFDDRDPVPGFVNWFHANTRDWVVEQEVLLGEGDDWEIGRVLETERNLRSLRQISLANVVAAKGSKPGAVRMLVVVKDVWSLRLNSDFQFGSNGLDYLLLNPAEENLAGVRASIGVLYLWQRDQHSFGGRVSYPRFAKSRYSIDTSSNFSVNRDTGAYEGTWGSFSYGLPLYSRHSQWGFNTSLAWNFDVTRRFAGAEIRLFEHPNNAGTVEQVPQVYETEALAANYSFVRSWGVEYKYNLSAGLELDHRKYQAPDLSEFSPETERAFREEILPVTDRRVSPFLQLRSFRTKFHRILNMETLGLQEDYALGHSVLARVYGGVEPLLSSRDHVGVDTGVGYTWPLGNGLVRAYLLNGILLGDGGRHDALVTARFRLATPTFFAGSRLHVDGVLAHRYRDYLQVSPFVLGSDGRLRGFDQNEFQGEDLVALNTELRTGAVDILSAQVGAAVFFDVGDVPEGLENTQLKAGTGLGLRVLFPQAERSVMRLDVSVPVAGYVAFAPRFLTTFGQAFSMPSL